jgi:hypothetical protein
MLFLTLADRTGLIECALFPDQYARWATSLHASIMRVTGRASATLDAVTVDVERMETLSARRLLPDENSPLTRRADGSAIEADAGAQRLAR